MKDFNSNELQAQTPALNWIENPDAEEGEALLMSGPEVEAEGTFSICGDYDEDGSIVAYRVFWPEAGIGADGFNSSKPFLSIEAAKAEAERLYQEFQPQPVRIVDADDELATAMNDSFNKCRQIDPTITLLEFIDLGLGDGTIFEECEKLKAEKDARLERIRSKIAERIGGVG